MKYRSKPTTIEAMQWVATDYPDPPFDLHTLADEIVEWVNANGGEARYGAGCNIGEHDCAFKEPRIAVRTATGWAYSKPGDYVVMGDKDFPAVTTNGGPPCCESYPHRTLREFTVQAAESFERRWEPQAEPETDSHDFLYDPTCPKCTTKPSRGQKEEQP